MADSKARSIASLADARSDEQRDGEQVRGRRRVRVRTSADGQIVEIRDPNGEVEVTVHVTDTGSVVKVNSASLEIAATEAVDVHCRSFTVHTEEAVEFVSGGSLRMQSEGDHDVDAKGDYRVKADTIWLN